MTRRLSDADRELWARVASTTRRLLPFPDPGPGESHGPQPDPRGPPPGAHPSAALPSSRITGSAELRGSVSFNPAPTLEERLAARPSQLDAGLDRRLRRGKQPPEARIDLHGMTRAQARTALTGFLLSAHGRGVRLILVITGKGRQRPDDDLALPDRIGALRHDLPGWLQMPPLAAIVQDLRPAHRSHGGSGAFYVYLRRRR